MNGELARGNLVLADGLLDDFLGQFGAFTVRDHPAGNAAAEDVEDDVEVEVTPLDRAAQFGDVPAPKLVGRRGQQLGFLLGRMNELVAALAGFPLLLEDAVHGANRAEVLAFVQQRSLRGCRRAVLESLFMEDQQHRGTLGLTERPSGSRPLQASRRLGSR